MTYGVYSGGSKLTQLAMAVEALEALQDGAVCHLFVTSSVIDMTLSR